MTTVSHDPFGRFSTLREIVVTKKTCAWCGGTRKSGGLFRYGTESDGLGARPNMDKELFCSKGCRDSYHG